MPVREPIPKVVYEEKYRKGVMNVKASLLPERFPYMDKSHRIVGIEVRGAGCLEDGREFQDVRVYTREIVEPTGKVEAIVGATDAQS